MLAHLLFVLEHDHGYLSVLRSMLAYMITIDINCAGIVRYFLHPREAILSQLETEAVKHKEDIEQFSNARKLIEDELKESEQQMREFLQSSPALAAKLKAV